MAAPGAVVVGVGREALLWRMPLSMNLVKPLRKCPKPSGPWAYDAEPWISGKYQSL